MHCVTNPRPSPLPPKNTIFNPQGQPRATSTVILLLHGFGGGVFAWRHVMRPLADASGLSVLAFDRPGFGLTSRPPRPPDAPGGNRHNPYAQRFQARMTLELCRRLHIASLVLMGGFRWSCRGREGVWLARGSPEACKY